MLLAGQSFAAVKTYKDPKTGHVIRSDSESCGGKCTWYYDTTTRDVKFEKNANVPDGEEVIIPANLYRGGITGWSNDAEKRAMRNVTIGEGITGMEKWALASYGGYTTGAAGGTLTLPSTYKNNPEHTGVYGAELWNVSFGTIDASAIKDTHLYIPSSASKNVILDPNSNVTTLFESSYGKYPEKINVVCKGELAKCESMITLQRGATTEVTSEYYKGIGKDGNYEEWSDAGKAVYEDETKQKPLGKYDFAGNQIGRYEYDGGGNLVAAYENGKALYERTHYTPPEAAAAMPDKNAKYSIKIDF